MLENKKKLSILIVFVYLISLLPYVIASNAGESGIVIETKKVEVTSLPVDVQDLLLYKDSCNLILIEDPLNKVVKKGRVVNQIKLVLSRQNQEEGSFVRIDNIAVDIYVPSNLILNINQPFEKLIIGEANKAELGGIIEFISYYDLMPIFTLSKLIFFAGGVFVVFILSFLFHRMFALWNVPAILALYSFQSLLVMLMAILNNIEVGDMQMIFAGFFIILVPLTIWLQKYEKSEKGKQKICEWYMLNKNMLLNIKNKLWIKLYK